MNLNRTIAQTFFTQIPIQLFGIISGIFIARLIGPEGKGIFAIYQANAQLIATFFSLSLGNALTYFLPQQSISKEKLLAIVLYLILFSGIIILLLMLFFYFTNYPQILFPLKYSNIFFLIWLFFYSFFTLIITLSYGFFQGLKLFSKYNKILLLNSFINLLLYSVLFIFFFFKNNQITLYLVFLALLICSFINILQIYYSFKKNTNIVPDFKISFKNDIFPMFNYTLNTHLSVFIVFLNSRLNLWILNYYLDEASIGLFSLAINLFVIFNIITAAISNVLMPYLTSTPKLLQIEMFYKYSKLNNALIILLSIFSFFIIDYLLPILYGYDFKNAAFLFKLILPGIVFLSISRLYAVYIAANNKQNYNFFATLLSFIFNIFITIIFIKLYGLSGAAIATSVTYFITFLILFYYVHIKMNVPIKNYFYFNYKEIKLLLEKK